MTKKQVDHQANWVVEPTQLKNPGCIIFLGIWDENVQKTYIDKPPLHIKVMISTRSTYTLPTEGPPDMEVGF